MQALMLGAAQISAHCLELAGLWLLQVAIISAAAVCVRVMTPSINCLPWLLGETLDNEQWQQLQRLRTQRKSNQSNRSRKDSVDASETPTKLYML